MNDRTMTAAICGSLVIAAASWPRPTAQLLSAAGCNGSAGCRVCKDCSQCDYCHRLGGHCGVCSPIGAHQVVTGRNSRGQAIGPNIAVPVDEQGRPRRQPFDDGLPFPGSEERYRPSPKAVRSTPPACHGGLICNACPSGQRGHPDCKGCRYCSDESRVCPNCPPIKRHAWAKFVGPPAPFN